MKIDILCPPVDHPVNDWLNDWVKKREHVHKAAVKRSTENLGGGDILFLISCSVIVPQEVRKLYRHTLVVHASDLPKGRGWSPHIWEIVSGADEITLSLLDAEDLVDTGAIWSKQRVRVPKDALYDEINNLIFEAETALMDRAVEMIEAGPRPTAQSDTLSTYYRRRTPADSGLDISRPLADLFDAIRVADPERYPAHFSIHGHTYEIRIRKVERNE